MPFDPSQPFEKVDTGGFDPSQPFEKVEEPGRVESAIHGVVNNVPFGPQIASGLDTLAGKMGVQVPGLLPNKQTYSENLDKYNQAFSAGKKAHPETYYPGAIVGALSPLAIPGAGAVLKASPVAGNAALGAANAVSNTDLLKEPKRAVGEALGGAAIGGATAGLLGKIFPQPESLENLANKKATESIGLGERYLKALGPDEYEKLGPAIKDLGLVGTNKEELLQKALQSQKEIGQRIGNIGKELDSAGIKASEDDILGAVSKLQGKAGETANLENPELRKLAIWHNKGANDIFNKIGDDPSWESIKNLKQAYGKAAFSDTGEVKNEASKNVYFTLRDMLKGLTERAQDHPSLPSEYKQALSDYHRMDPIVEGLSSFVGRERAGVSGHGLGHGFLSKIIRSLPGQSNPKINLATAAGATMVSPHLGPIMALPTLTNPAVQSKAFSALSQKLPGIQQGSTQELSDFLQSKFGEKKKEFEE